MELTHASFFSGVGGLDLGLERAGWRTVSFSEIDPYASAVLAERWPDVPNLGDITSLRASVGLGRELDGADHAERATGGRLPRESADASLWSGGFPCQDLSVAGKRRGFNGERSVLAFAFLDLVERHRPPAILLENVPGLLSSNAGKDFGALLSRLAELGYWWAYRILDAQFFGVPQRRRRVFICALHAGAGFGADSAAAVLSVGARCGGHSAESDEARTGVALGLGDRPELAGSLTRRYGKGINTTLDDGATVVSASPHPGGNGAPHGMAGRLDDREVVGTLRVGPQRPQDGGPGDTVPVIVNALDQQRGGADDNAGQAGHLIPYVKRGRAQTDEDAESWGEGDVMPTLNAFDVGDTRTTAAIIGGHAADDPLLPLGLDSHRYRCCGNGVVSNVSEWLGRRIARAVQEQAA